MCYVLFGVSALELLGGPLHTTATCDLAPEVLKYFAVQISIVCGLKSHRILPAIVFLSSSYVTIVDVCCLFPYHFPVKRHRMEVDV